MDASKTVIVAGHICLDITPVFPYRGATKLESILRPGQLTHVDGVNIHVGGAVANTGIAMKLLGAPVQLVGKIGADAFGELVLNELKEHDAAENMIVSADTQTSYSVVLAIPGMDRIFIHASGANDSFCCGDLDSFLFEKVGLFHFGYPTVMREMYRNDGAELVRMLQRVKEAGAAVSLDMAAIDASTEAGAVDWGTVLRKALPYVDFFVPSAEEICYMLDWDRYQDWLQRAAGRDVCEILTLADIQPLAKKILDLGAKVALIKCGAAGMYCQTASKEKINGLCQTLELPVGEWAEKNIFERSYIPDAVLSGTGAGDTSIAAFLTSILREKPLTEALHMAAAAGACCVASYDALSGLKSLDEMKERIRAGWPKQENSRFANL